MVVADCELRTRRVIKESTAENVEPFQSKMTHFITKGTLVNLMSVSSYKLPTAVTVWLISYTLLVSSDSLINSNYSSSHSADADKLTQLSGCWCWWTDPVDANDAVFIFSCRDLFNVLNWVKVWIWSCLILSEKPVNTWHICIDTNFECACSALVKNSDGWQKY